MMIPWPIKILLKVIIAHLPIPYAWWQKLGVFRHGQMDRATYAHKIFSIHTARAYPDGLPPHLTFLELGPGDSLASCLLTSAHHARHVYLSDVGAFAERRMDTYRRLADDFSGLGLQVPDLSTCDDLEDLLRRCNATYLTHGLADLSPIPDGSIDFSWSHSVLEHVRRDDVQNLFEILHRITKPGGFSSHIVDLQDHLNHSLNNLRFPAKIWEASWFSKAGFYTNRLQAGMIMKIAQDTGFKMIFSERGHWPHLPLKREQLDPLFQDIDENELRTRTFSMFLQRI